MQARAWIDAERAFRTAIGLYDSPNTHLLLAQTLVGEERFAEAYNEYDSTVGLAAVCAQVPGSQTRYAPTVSRSVTERDQLKDRVALLTVRAGDDAPSGAAVKVDAHALTDHELGRPRAFAPGVLVVRATAQGFADFNKTLDLRAGSADTLTVEWSRPVVDNTVAAPVQYRDVRRVSPLRPAGIAMAVVGGVTAIAGGGMYFAGRGVFQRLETDCATRQCTESEISAGQTLETAGLGMFWAGIGVGALGAVFAIAAPTRTEHVPITAWITPGMLHVGGRF